MTQEEIYQHICEWSAFRRRHQAGIFEVMFKDIDYTLSEEDLNQIIAELAKFFDLQIAQIHSYCETLAKIDVEGEDGTGSELYYNWQLLRKQGINNRDAFTLCMVHELAHQYFKDKRFMLCASERWCHELLADYIAGIYSELKHLATGKYKYVVKQLQASLSHPAGEHRAAAVEYARECVQKHRWRSIDSAISGFPTFIYERQKIINKEFYNCMQI